MIETPGELRTPETAESRVLRALLKRSVTGPAEPACAASPTPADAAATPPPAGVSAPASGLDLVAVVAALLADPSRPDPNWLPGAEAPAPEAAEAPASPVGPLLGGPTGLGTGATRIPAPLAPADSQPAPAPQLALRLPSGPSGLGTAASRLIGVQPAPEASAPGAAEDADDSIPPLFCPGAVRDNPALGEEVNNRLVDWAGEIGIFPGALEKLRSDNFGRLIMLTHPSTDDPDRLLAVTKCVVAEWATDDYYVDEVELGADPDILGSRLAILLGIVDPAALTVKYAPQLDAYREAEPIARAFRSAMEHLAQYASTTQMGRFQHQMAMLFVAWNQEADWHRNKRTPPIWEYLVQRHLNCYMPPMILIDPVAGYELPAFEFYDPRVRRAVTFAAHAAVLINDLHSAPFESETDFNLPRVIAAEENCSQREAIKRTVELHNEMMQTFVAEATVLSLAGSPMLKRFFAEVWAWCGGSREWHATTGRYRRSGGE